MRGWQKPSQIAYFKRVRKIVKNTISFTSEWKDSGPMERVFRKFYIWIFWEPVVTCLSIWQNSALIGRIFMKFDIWGFFRNLSGKLMFHSNLTRTDTVQKDTYLFLKTRLILLKMINFQKKILEKMKIYFMLRNIFFRKSWRLWDNVKSMVQPDK